MNLHMRNLTGPVHLMPGELLPPFCKRGGMQTFAQYKPILSSCESSHAAGESRSKNPECSVINVSDARQPQAFEINEIVPCGVMAINTF